MRSLLMAAAGSLLLAGPALALDVNMTGERQTACTLELTNGGTLAISTDGKTFGTTEVGGVTAAITVASVGNNTVSVAAPTMTASPVGYEDGAQVVSVKYAGEDDLSSATSDWGSATTTFTANSLASSTVNIDGRIANDDGFPVGTYTIQTVVTCAATI